MAVTADMVAGVRAKLRDFPKYFEINEGALNVLTVRLPHPYVTPSALQVYVTTPPAPPATNPVTAITSKWTLDERNGLLKLSDETYLGANVTVAGYHYVWFADIDLIHAVQEVTAEALYDSEESLASLSEVQAEVVEMGAVVRALWSLCVELALDIDVSTPEGMFIPAHQRYAQVLQMMQYWEGEYDKRAASLNMGLGKLEQWKLRRVSRTTGRYVPVYRDREFDDPRWPVRLYPPIPEGIPDDTETPLWAKAKRLSEVTMGNYPAASFPGVLGRGD